GCSAGRGAGPGALLVLGALVLGRRRRAVAIAAVLAPAVAHGEPTRNVDLTVFDPTPATSGSAFQLQTAEVGAPGSFVATAFVSYAKGALVLDTGQPTVDVVVRNRTMLSVGGAYAF